MGRFVKFLFCIFLLGTLLQFAQPPHELEAASNTIDISTTGTYGVGGSTDNKGYFYADKKIVIDGIRIPVSFNDMQSNTNCYFVLTDTAGHTLLYKYQEWGPIDSLTDIRTINISPIVLNANEHYQVGISNSYGGIGNMSGSVQNKSANGVNFTFVKGDNSRAYGLSFKIYNNIPLVDLTPTAPNQTYSAISGHDIIHCSANIYDQDEGDSITSLKYSIDNDLSGDLTSAFDVLNLGQTLPKVAINSAPGDTFNFDIKPFTNYPSLTDGAHTLYIYTTDDKGGVGKASISFNADRTPPTIEGTFNQVDSKNSFFKLHFVGTDASGGPSLNLECRDENNNYIPELSASSLGTPITTIETYLDSSKAEFGEGKLITGTITGTDSVGNSVTKQIKIKIDSTGTTLPNGL
ncbi:hypothetical protein [Desulfotomaculum nigrificans]|uniref:hypothetical protein n=1 Tax=Desulfotomaculum nigrificans TaxID=1565 RepID=UPI0001FAE59D|nr:hypothetical protein [Desulfotomaculum nigrificans]